MLVYFFIVWMKLAGFAIPQKAKPLELRLLWLIKTNLLQSKREKEVLQKSCLVLLNFFKKSKEFFFEKWLFFVKTNKLALFNEEKGSLNIPEGRKKLLLKLIKLLNKTISRSLMIFLCWKASSKRIIFTLKLVIRSCAPLIRLLLTAIGMRWIF